MPGSPGFVIGRALAMRGACRRVLVGCALALVVGLSLGGCQLDPNAVKQDPFLQELVAAQQQSATPKLGTPFEVGNTRWVIQRTEAAHRLALGNQQLAARGVYVVVHFSFTSLMETPQHAPADILVLQSGSATFTADAPATAAFTTWTHEADLLTALLQPNRAVVSALVFDVPRAVAGALTLQVHSLPDPNQSQPLSI